jgi:hypothetical protein
MRCEMTFKCRQTKENTSGYIASWPSSSVVTKPSGAEL